VFLLNATQQTLLLAFIAPAMLAIGLKSSPGELRDFLHSKVLLRNALVVNFLLVPAVGFAIGLLWPLDQSTARALMLLACAPGGVSALQFTTKVKGKLAIAGSVFVALVVVSLLVTPALVWLAAPAEVNLAIPYGRIVATVLVLLVVPLGLGLALGQLATRAAQLLAKVLTLVSLVSFVAFAINTGSTRQEALAQVGLSGMLAFLLFFAISLGLGWYMGGNDGPVRRILATATSMRNTAFCLTIAESTAPNSPIIIPLVAFSYLMLVPNSVYAIGGLIMDKAKDRRARRRQPPHGEPPRAA
jgi:BASS family bile acid:Na+ symporter